MAKHTTRARPPEKPLTAKALNAFFDAVAAGVEKSEFVEHTAQDTLSAVATSVLPIADPLPKHEALGYVLAATQKGNEANRWRNHRTLPETLGELKDRIAETNLHFHEEPSEDIARKVYNGIMNKAYRAAEKEMERAQSPSHRE